MSTECFLLKSPEDQSIYFLGKGFEEGPLPAFFYFSLSGEESLILHPYAQPAQILKELPLRIFSFTLPGHNKPQDKFHAIEFWAQQMALGNPIIDDFIEDVLRSIEWLIAIHLVDPLYMVTGGLSRGAFTATLLSMREKRMKALLGFAPLISLEEVEEFKKPRNSTSLKDQLQKLNLAAHIEELFHLKGLRFYIGNRDTRVNTDACYTFVREFTEKAYTQKNRQTQCELILYPSIGFKGHGTPSEIFLEGSLWLKKYLLH
jgi:hypothetical protein